MEIEFLAWFEIVLSIENLNEKWGQRKYRFKISNFYLYCMTILIYFLQPFLVIQSWWRKVPTAAACCSLWPFQEATCKNRPGFNWQTGDRPRHLVRPHQGSHTKLDMSSSPTFLKTCHICNEGEKGISWWSGRGPSGRVLVWEEYDFPWLPAIFSPQAALLESLMKCDGFIRRYSPRLGQVLINYI